MKSRKLRKFLMLLASALLLVSVTVGATVAYLTATTDPVTNTFSVGNVAITLDEAFVNADGEKIVGEGAGRGDGNAYDLFPAKSYDKDPTVHVGANSEDGWLFVKVENGIEDIEAETNTIAAQMEDNGWTELADYPGVYAYEEVVSANEDVVVFESFTIDEAVDGDTLAEYSDAEITIQAYMVQEDGFTTAAAAYAAAPCNAWTTPSTPEDDNI